MLSKDSGAARKEADYLLPAIFPLPRTMLTIRKGLRSFQDMQQEMRAQSAAAVDFSQEALHALRQQRLENGITNIMGVLARQEDGPYSPDIGVHDVVIMSWPLLYADIPSWIMKLDISAQKRVCVCATVGDGPFARGVFEATGRRLAAGLGFTSISCDFLHCCLGVPANTAFVREEPGNDRDSLEGAPDAQRRMFHDLTEEEKKKVRNAVFGPGG
jgi:hypothetical protein